MGQRLAEEAPALADLVMPIPDSGTPAAIGFAKASGIPYEEGLIKNRYVGRTFIQPDQDLRRQGIKLKFNPLDEIAGRRVVIVDDSIVRGNTMQQLIAMLLDAGAVEVHVRISSPPVVSPCFYGIDMADEDELAAAHRSVEEMRDYIGATSLHYLSLDGMQWAARMPEASVCRACFTRDYPTAVPADGRRKMRFEPPLRPRRGSMPIGVCPRPSRQLVTAPLHRTCDLLLRATRGVTIAVVSSRERKRRQPGLATDDPAFVGWHQLVRGVQASQVDFDFVVAASENGRAAPGTEKPPGIFACLALDRHRILREDAGTVKKGPMMLAAVETVTEADPVGES